MKIRIKGNSLRYRLTKSDIANLAKTGYLQEETHFGDETFIYALKVLAGKLLKAEYFNNTITLFMPPHMLSALVNTDQVGFTEKGGILQLLVEKDFTCLDTVEEDQSDNYPNPLTIQNN
jgi:hypothetical protein